MDILGGSGIIVPTTVEDREKLKNAINEAVNAKIRIDSESELIKEIVSDAAEAFDIPKPLLNKLIKTVHKRDFAKTRAEYEDFEALYDQLIEGIE